MKAVGSPSSSGPEGPPTPPHASPLCHPCFLPPSRVACDCPEDVRSSWKVIQHPLITFVPSISQCLNLASGAWALGTQLLSPPTPHPQQKQEYESQDGTSPLAPVPYRPGGGSGTSPGGRGAGGTLDSGRDPSFCSCQLELQVMMQKNDTRQSPAPCNDGAACRGRGEKVARMLGTQAQRSDKPGFSVFTPLPASTGQVSQPPWVFSHLEHGDNPRISQVRWSGNRNEMKRAKHRASGASPADSAAADIEVAGRVEWPPHTSGLALFLHLLHVHLPLLQRTRRQREVSCQALVQTQLADYRAGT